MFRKRSHYYLLALLCGILAFAIVLNLLSNSKEVQIDRLSTQIVTPPISSNPITDCSSPNVWESTNMSSSNPIPFAYDPLFPDIGLKRKSWKPLLVLFLADKSLYETQLEQRAREFVEVAKKNEYIELYGPFGPGFDGWNPTLDPAANIRKKFGNVNFTVLWTDYIIGGTAKSLLPKLSQRVAPIQTLHAHELWCANPPECLDRTLDPLVENVNVVFGAYANQFAHFSKLLWNPERLTYHLPHGANSALFCANRSIAQLTERLNKTILIGNLARTLYPMRNFLNSLIVNGTLRELAITFPGDARYRKDLNEALERRQAYVETLRQYKAALVTRSVRDLALRKYIETAMSGTLAIGNIPSERYDFFSKFVINIGENPTPESIHKVISWWLANDEARIKHVRMAQELVCDAFSLESMVQRMVDIWHLYLDEGLRGFVSPFPFIIRPPHYLNN